MTRHTGAPAAGRRLLTMALALACCPAPIHAAPSEAEADGAPEIETPDPASGLGLTAELTLSSHYVFRGLNVFQESDQLDHRPLLAPGLTWEAFDTGLSLGYWGAFQIYGDNLSRNIDLGIGAEQDLYATFETELAKGVSLEAFLFWYFFPFADEQDAGTSVPSYLEPGVTFGAQLGVDLSLTASYFAGLQDTLSEWRYLYLSPCLSRAFELTADVSLEVALSYGFKLHQPDSTVEENLHDLQLLVRLPIELSDGIVLSPLAGAAWTDLLEPELAPDRPTGPAPSSTSSGRDSRNGWVAWGGLTVSAGI